MEAPAVAERARPEGEVAAPPDGERKQVTVLFADVMGSMDMAEQTDPEEWRQIMQRFFSLLSDGVRRFEGTVDKFTGDGIMALFGAPIAHEDHAPRACFAALQIGELVSEYAGELRRAKGLSFSVRIGINSGEVVAGAIGEDHKPEYTAVGHTVGLAQRMEALAEPGKAYLTEHAADLARGYLELKDLGEFEVKGASRPIKVFELVGAGSARSRLDLSRERGLSRFVGRAEEMEVLEEALERTEEGRGAVIGVVADPGVGKSRLCHEFAERCRARGIEVYEAQAQAHGQAIPFLPVLQMMRGYFGIEDRDSERVAREKIAGRLLLLDPDFADDLPLVFDFLAVPDPERPAPQVSAEARERLLRGVIRRLYRVPGRTDGGGQRDRGPALDGRGQRGVPGGDGRRGGRNRDPGGGQLPAGVRGRVGGLAGLPADRADAARAGVHQGAAGRPGRRRSLDRRPRRPDPRADRRQPVLHRGGRPGAGRKPATSRGNAAPTG